MNIATRLVALGTVLVACAPAAQAPPERFRGTIQSFDGQTLMVATASDGAVRLRVSDMTGINGLEAKTAADIGANTFIGATAVRDAAGRWQATEIHIFPEAMRGAGEGHYAWDLPESTMTNGAVTGNVAAGAGRSLKVTYADGEADIDVTPRTAIVGLTLGDRSLLVQGATVFALAVPQEDGAADAVVADAVAIIVETNGVKPPM